jgi:hypothetical protein
MVRVLAIMAANAIFGRMAFFMADVLPNINSPFFHFLHSGPPIIGCGHLPL